MKWFIFFCLIVANDILSTDNIVSFMRNREMGGKANPKQLKDSLMAIQYPVTIQLLQNIQYPFDFLKSIPQEYIPQGTASFEDNLYMDIITAGLKNRSQYFKNAVLSKHLDSNYSRLNHCIHIALIDAGAKHEDSLRVIYANRGKKDYDYAKALLLRGANPNATCKFYLPGQSEVLEEHLELSQLTDLDLIEVLVDAGANVMTRSPVSNMTLVHLAAGYEKYESEVLKFYLEKGVEVNAKDFIGFTALERIIHNGNSYVLAAQHKMMQEKVLLLLSHGASYHKAMNLIEERLSWNHPEQLQKLQLIKEALTIHDKQQQFKSDCLMDCN